MQSLNRRRWSVRRSEQVGDNLARLMAGQGLTVDQVVRQTGVDRRTIRGILRGASRPHAKTLRRLADGLGVRADEFFIDPAQLLFRRFAPKPRPAVVEAVETHGELFHHWSKADFDRLHRCLDRQDEETVQDVLRLVRRMNEHRELHAILDVLIDGKLARLVCGLLRLFFRETTKQNRERARRCATNS